LVAHGNPADYVSGLHHALIAGAALAAAGAVVTMRLLRVRREPVAAGELATGAVRA